MASNNLALGKLMSTRPLICTLILLKVARKHKYELPGGIVLLLGWLMRM